MTSVLNVDTIADKAGTGPVGLTKQSAAKVTIAANDDAVLFKSFNVSSGVDQATGDYKYNLTNALTTTTAENCVTACALGYENIIRVKTADSTTSVLDLHSMNTSGSSANGWHAAAIHGDLA
jgi:hypothetical protein